MSAVAETQDLKARVAEALAKNPRAMTLMMARQYGVPEAQILCAFPADKCRELAVGGEKTQELIRALEGLGRLHVITSNDACTLETYGYFGGFSLTGPFFNVQTDTVDMHIHHGNIGSAFAVIKPSHQDGQMTYSIQFFSSEGRSAFKVFLYKSVTEKEGAEVESAIKAWEEIREKFAK